MTQNAQRQSRKHRRFVDVDKVSRLLFDSLEVPGRPSEPPEPPEASAARRRSLWPSSGIRSLETFLDDVANKFGDVRPDIRSALTGDSEPSLGLDVCDDALDVARMPETSPHHRAAIKEIEPEQHDVTDDEMMSAIRGVMLEQKREKSRRSLPELEAPQPLEDDHGQGAQTFGSTDLVVVKCRAMVATTGWQRVVPPPQRVAPWIICGTAVLVNPFVMGVVTVLGLATLLAFTMYMGPDLPFGPKPLG